MVSNLASVFALLTIKSLQIVVQQCVVLEGKKGIRATLFELYIVHTLGSSYSLIRAPLDRIF